MCVCVSEIFEGKTYIESVDCWALGVIAYILLCGFPPWKNDTPKQLATEVIRCKPRFTSTAWTVVSTEAKDLIRKLLCPESKRYTALQILKHTVSIILHTAQREGQVQLFLF